MLRTSVTGDCGVWLVHEVANLGAEPMVTARGPIVAAHSLLHDCPFSFGGQKKAVVINPETVLHSSRVYFRCHSAVVRESRSVETKLRAEHRELGRCAS